LSAVTKLGMRILDRGTLKTFDAARVGAAAQVGRVVQLENIRLLELASKLGNYVPNRAASFDIDVEPTHTLADDLSILTVDCTFDLAVRDAALPDAVFVTAKVAFEMVYRLVVAPPPEELRENFFSAFAEINSVFNAWPYLREIVQTTTTRMNIPPVLVPIFRIGVPLSANMPETPTSLNFNVEGERGLRDDEHLGSDGDRSVIEGRAAALHCRVQEESFAGGRRLHEVGRAGRAVAT
jgi:hypothetical protein